MRLIVTRPEEDAKTLIARLKACGHEGIIAPMISIEYLKEVFIEDRNWQAILITSANSIKALQALRLVSNLRHIRVLAVGPASLSAARQAGFTSIVSADGNLPALVKLALERLSPDEGPLLYPSGVITSGDLKNLLQEKGFECKRVRLYEAIGATTMPEQGASALAHHKVDGVVLYSPRTAKIWAECVKNSTQRQTAGKLTHWCLSAAVGEALKSALALEDVSVDIRIACEPNETSLLEAICADNVA